MTDEEIIFFFCLQRVINASKDNQHMHIIPPSTPHFSIHYTKKVCNPHTKYGSTCSIIGMGMSPSIIDVWVNNYYHEFFNGAVYISVNFFLQKGRLVPGLSLDITVQFRPTEWKYYYDCIRIHCKVCDTCTFTVHYPVI